MTATRLPACAGLDRRVFIAASIFGWIPFLLEQWAFVRLAVPAVVALLVLVLVDAYATPGKRSPLGPVRDAAFGLMVAGLTGSVPLPVMLMGGGMSVLLVSGLRMLFPPDENRPRGAT